MASGKTFLNSYAFQNGTDAVIFSAASTQYFCNVEGGLNSQQVRSTNEVRAQIKIYEACTIRNFQVLVLSNARATSTLATLRINGANGNQSVLIGAVATGLFQDGTHSDALSAGDLISVGMLTGTGVANLVVCGFYLEVETAIGTVSYHAFNISDAAPIAAYSINRFCLEGCNFRTTFPNSLGSANNTTRSIVQAPGTFKNLRIFLSLNTVSAGVLSATLYKNGVATALTIPLLSVGVGAFEDVSHSVHVVAGDFVEFVLDSTGGTSGLLTFTVMQVEFLSDATTWTNWRSNVGMGGPQGFTVVGTFFTSMSGGGIYGNTPEVNTGFKIGFPCMVSQLFTTWTAGGTNGDTFTVRKNNADSNVQITFPGSASGTTLFQDTTHSVQFAAGDLFDMRVTLVSVFGGAGGPSTGGIMLDNTPPPSPPPYGGSILLTGVG